jgi:hypothetical protein
VHASYRAPGAPHRAEPAVEARRTCFGFLADVTEAQRAARALEKLMNVLRDKDRRARR